MRLVGRDNDKRKLYGSMTQVCKDGSTLARLVLEVCCMDMCDNGGEGCVEIGYFR